MKAIIISVLLMFSFNAMALGSATTNDGYVACFKKEWLENMTSFVVADDKGSFNAYIKSKKCLILKEGLKVTLTESPGVFGGKAGFVFNGVSLWTVREGLSY